MYRYIIWYLDKEPGGTLPGFTEAAAKTGYSNFDTVVINRRCSFLAMFKCTEFESQSQGRLG